MLGAPPIARHVNPARSASILGLWVALSPLLILAVGAAALFIPPLGLGGLLFWGLLITHWWVWTIGGLVSIVFGVRRRSIGGIAGGGIGLLESGVMLFAWLGV
jgi:hypothetical protein